MMNFKDRYEMLVWLDEVLYGKLEDSVDDISGATNASTGRCDLEIMFKNGDTARISISMTDGNGVTK